MMAAPPDPDPVAVSGHPELYQANTPSAFWKLVDGLPEAVWREAAPPLLTEIPGAVHALAAGGWPGLMAYTLGEGQFGPDHWRLSRAKRFYYSWVRGLVPPQLKPALRRVVAGSASHRPILSWPAEDRFARFQFRLLGAVLRLSGLPVARYVHFWPDGRRFALVLTHDVEGTNGQRFVREVADLEEELGYRSCFNFVPEGYADDPQLRAELLQRGFEVGVHGLRHDGRLFSSWSTFSERARSINQVVAEWGARGFRAPLMHRNPQWLQALDVDYDCSFFDTDPYEPIAGGTMSPWPFVMGRLVELPYTLVQDHTLLETLRETTPTVWLRKVEHLRRFRGMALLNTHPDYLRERPGMAVYRRFLEDVSAKEDCWAALPRDAATWWRSRSDASVSDVIAGTVRVSSGGATVGEARPTSDGVELSFGE